MFERRIYAVEQSDLLIYRAMAACGFVMAVCGSLKVLSKPFYLIASHKGKNYYVFYAISENSDTFACDIT
ncbi:hypothetical protein DET65_0753 [Sunxiuqinia elliptica]|jgi:hypothetical protein|uniref:Uncharacterized protein n=1 Tax=Sunxiuqinia elliptica TaxID=655355 RepID=A0A4R6H9Q2_9BACT|nr:hypothetical protein DET52_101195 [Sunxiuqinia elliptica]TDO64392.1 hypothetical protein DET65_0753 [Sunxiuqinia elliptica]